VIDDLLEVHRETDRAVRRLERRHRGRLQCGCGCHDCCVDGVTVFEIEALRIRNAHEALLRDGDPHPEGKCAFLNPDGACRIYEDRPYVCRTQGLPLRWVEDAPDGSPVEHRDICPLNDAGTPITELDPGDCWLLGPVEGRIAELQSRLDGGEMRRVPLRSLFARGRGAGQSLAEWWKQRTRS
jgi:hypothetical protein